MEKLLKYISKLETTTEKNKDKKDLYIAKINYYYKQIGGAKDSLVSKIGFDGLKQTFREDTILAKVIEQLCSGLIGPYDRLFKQLYLTNDNIGTEKLVQVHILESILRNINSSCDNSCTNTQIDTLLRHTYLLHKYYEKSITGRRIEITFQIIFNLLRLKLKHGMQTSEKILSDKDIDFIIANITMPMTTSYISSFKNNLKTYLQYYFDKPRDKPTQGALYAAPIKNDDIYEIQGLLRQYKTTTGKIPSTTLRRN